MNKIVWIGLCALAVLGLGFSSSGSPPGESDASETQWESYCGPDDLGPSFCCSNPNPACVDAIMARYAAQYAELRAACCALQGIAEDVYRENQYACWLSYLDCLAGGGALAACGAARQTCEQDETDKFNSNMAIIRDNFEADKAALIAARDAELQLCCE